MGSRLARFGRKAADVVRADLQALRELLTERAVWKELWRKMGSEGDLREPRVHALFLLLLLAAGLTWLAGFVLLRAMGHPWLQTWNLAWGLWGVGFATTVALPLPFEPALLAAHATGGALVAVVAAATSKTLGAGLVLLLGDALRRKLHDLKEDHKWVRGFIEATERFAHRWSYPAFGLLLAVPLFPDTLPVYIFAVMGLRPGLFLLTNVVGIGVRVALILWLGDSLAAWKPWV